MSDEWIDYKAAAELMRRPAAYLRERNADGVTFKYFPEIERWQPGGRRTKLFVRHEHVKRWIERSRMPVEVKPVFSGIGYQSIIPELQRLGAPRALYRALGIKEIRQ